MAYSNTLQVNGHLYCRECSSAIPEGFLACPACVGFVQMRGHWVVPKPSTQPPLEPEEQQPLLFVGTPEYPA